MTVALTAPTLTDELAGISTARPRWHAWETGPQNLYATRSLTRDEMAAMETCLGVRYAGSGVTVYAETPLLLDMAITKWEHENGLVAA